MQSQRQMFFIGRLHCNFKVFSLKELITIRIMKVSVMISIFSITCQNPFTFMMNLLFLTFLQTILKLKEPVKSYW